MEDGGLRADFEQNKEKRLLIAVGAREGMRNEIDYKEESDAAITCTESSRVRSTLSLLALVSISHPQPTWPLLLRCV